VIFLKVLFFLVLFFFLAFSFCNFQKVKFFSTSSFSQQVYDTCMEDSYKSDLLDKKINDLIQEYSNSFLSFSFYEPYNNYSYDLQENKLYYGASLIKLLEANFLLQESLNGNISLSEKLSFCSKHIMPHSLFMENKSVGEEISLSDLIYYSLSLSDNSAHEMIFEYIGVDHLKSYAQQLGVTLSINDIEHFGNLTANDGMKILQETYRILSKNTIESNILKNALSNDYYNSLNFLDIPFLHKYGLYDDYYHDIGIYFDEVPYMISIFTLAGNSDYFHLVQDLSQKIYDIYLFNLQEKRSYCFQLKKIFLD